LDCIALAIGAQTQGAGAVFMFVGVLFVARVLLSAFWGVISMMVETPVVPEGDVADIRAGAAWHEQAVAI
jgi:hypothetical protein